MGENDTLFKDQEPQKPYPSPRPPTPGVAPWQKQSNKKRMAATNPTKSDIIKKQTSNLF